MAVARPLMSLALENLLCREVAVVAAAAAVKGGVEVVDMGLMAEAEAEAAEVGTAVEAEGMVEAMEEEAAGVVVLSVVKLGIWRETATRVDLKVVEIGTEAVAAVAVAVETAIAVVNLGISLEIVKAVAVDRLNC